MYIDIYIIPSVKRELNEVNFHKFEGQLFIFKVIFYDG